MNTDLTQTMVVAPRRWRWICLLAFGCAALVSPLVFAMSARQEFWIMVFGPLVIAISVSMIPKNAFALTLHHDGFEYRAAYKKYSIKWDQVRFIRTCSPSPGGPRVGWNYIPENQETLEDLGFFAGMPSVEGWLPIDYCISADELAKLMSRFQERALLTSD